ncbi:MraY family glycosyltransferase [Pseudomonas oryziphila]|uniref:Glycosyltransferase family 4 protein n=1 Tax=Pseudomonas entomophila TaxID=312306 RepID=A0A3S8UH97_9PSED|nr:glycosyltransferase family 4 protein [Pseudomonas oryziphila]AZL67612.1 glycosyltransferase family 4 protein [Pseudomonas oryziphila]
MIQWWLIPLVLFASLSLTAALRKYALSRNIIDVPNARSSHAVPTPRGGGIAIVAAFLMAAIMLGICEGLPDTTLFSVIGAGGLVAIIGFMDDRGHIAARWRLLGHFMAAAWALIWLGGFPQITVVGVALDLGWLGAGFAAIYLVWLLNLYNFMDGIDGIASVEAVFASAGMSLLYWLAGFEQLSVLPMLLAVAVCGFLYWNFPPAKIFMGDAGSGFLGIVLGVFSLQAAHQDSRLFWAWLILLGVFIVDATLTLLRRMLQGQRVYEAHCSHAYQHAARQYGKHLPVTLGVLALNIFWLFPLAFAVVCLGLDGAVGVLLAYAPLAALALRFRAGRPEEKRAN